MRVHPFMSKGPFAECDPLPSFYALACLQRTPPKEECQSSYDKNDSYQAYYRVKSNYERQNREGNANVA